MRGISRRNKQRKRGRNRVSPVKTADEIAIMRDSCAIAATVLDRLCSFVQPGMSTGEIDEEGRRLMAEFGAESACYQYQLDRKRFPAHTCLSVNEEIVHGIGRPDRVLKVGDEITVDVCSRFKGYIGDNARTIAVGVVHPKVENLLQHTRQALELAIEQAQPGRRVSEISRAVESFIRPLGYGIVEDFVGHGVGQSIHEEPQVPNYTSFNGPDRVLKPGMTIAIEPMINLGTHKWHYLSDGWTAVTDDGQPSAHFEHTVLITEDGNEILTRPLA